MTVVEEIQAAIEKLTQQRNLATEGPWYAWRPQSGRGNSSVDAQTHDPDNPDMVVEGGSDDVDLIVTLHRTIDAQLGLLKRGLVWANLATEGQSPGFLVDVELALARAINGSAS